MAYKKLIDLVCKFDSGVVELPLMQRDYVWPAAKVVDLLDSLYKRWPIFECADPSGVLASRSSKRFRRQ